MNRRIGRPSPAMVVAIAALIVALSGTAIAGGVLNKKKVKKITNKVSKKVANKQITKRAPGLSVASANTANSANSAGNAAGAELLDGLDSGDFARSDDVHTRRVVVPIPNPGFTVIDVIREGDLDLEVVCQRLGMGGAVDAFLRVLSPTASPASAVRVTFPGGGALASTDEAGEDDSINLLLATSDGDPWRGVHFIAAGQDGSVLSGTAFARIAGGNCTWVLTALG